MKIPFVCSVSFSHWFSWVFILLFHEFLDRQTHRQMDTTHTHRDVVVVPVYDRSVV